MDNIRIFVDRMKAAKDDNEAMSYIIVMLAGCAMTNKGISALQLTDICDALSAYFESKQMRRVGNG